MISTLVNWPLDSLSLMRTSLPVEGGGPSKVKIKVPENSATPSTDMSAAPVFEAFKVRIDEGSIMNDPTIIIMSAKLTSDQTQGRAIGDKARPIIDPICPTSPK